MADREYHVCPICSRHHIDDHMSHHHLLPAVNHLPKGEPTIYICNTCHSVIHFCHTNDELRFLYGDWESILTSEKIMSMVELYKYKADNCVFKIKRLKTLLKCCA